MTNDARAFRLQDEITQMGATNDRADTVAQANLTANSFATEARTLINDRDFIARRDLNVERIISKHHKQKLKSWRGFALAVAHRAKCAPL